MGALVGYGFAVLIGIALGLIITVIGLFFGNIILFDSIALAILSGCLSYSLLHLHPAFAILIGLAMLVGLFFLQHTAVGFWIIGGLLSLLWGFIFGFFAYDISGGDMIWFYVVMGLGALLMIGLHLHARDSV